MCQPLHNTSPSIVADIVSHDSPVGILTVGLIPRAARDGPVICVTRHTFSRRQVTNSL